MGTFRTISTTPARLMSRAVKDIPLVRLSHTKIKGQPWPGPFVAVDIKAKTKTHPAAAKLFQTQELEFGMTGTCDPRSTDRSWLAPTASTSRTGRRVKLDRLEIAGATLLWPRLIVRNTLRTTLRNAAARHRSSWLEPIRSRDSNQ